MPSSCIRRPMPRLSKIYGKDTKMINPQKRVIIDICTQKRFFIAGNSSCIRDHSRILKGLRRIMALARHMDIRIISICTYARNYFYEIDRDKIRFTIFQNKIFFPAVDSTDLQRDLLLRYQQVILESRSSDPFKEPRIERLLSELKADELIVIGAVTEKAVQATVQGLLQRGKTVKLVVDAIGMHDKKAAKLALRKMKAKGARLVKTHDLAGTTRLRYVGACSCEFCRNQKAKDVLAKRPLLQTSAVN